VIASLSISWNILLTVFLFLFLILFRFVVVWHPPCISDGDNSSAPPPAVPSRENRGVHGSKMKKGVHLDHDYTVRLLSDLVADCSSGHSWLEVWDALQTSATMAHTIQRQLTPT
jgi:hypothetical protein